MMTRLIATYFKSLVSPYKHHCEDDHLSIPESVGISWSFVVFNGVLRILLINLVIISISLSIPDLQEYLNIFNQNGHIGYYFLVLSTILDIIFFPLFLLFLIQFWTFIIKSFASFLKVEGDVDDKVERVVVSSMSSHVFMAIPIFGNIVQKISGLILLFIGMKKQLGFSSAVSICALLSPVIMVMLISLVFMGTFVFKNL